MQRSFRQRSAIKSCVESGKTVAGTFEIIKKAYPEESLARRDMFRWHNVFLESREELAGRSRVLQRPSSRDDNVKRVRELLNTLNEC